MKKVWILMFDGTTGPPPDYEVIESPEVKGVFDSYEKALSVLNRYPFRPTMEYYTREDFSIEEHDIQ